MLSDAFPPFSGEMKGVKTAVLKYVVQSGLPVRQSLKIHAAHESQLFEWKRRAP